MSGSYSGVLSLIPMLNDNRLVEISVTQQQANAALFVDCNQNTTAQTRGLDQNTTYGLQAAHPVQQPPHFGILVLPRIYTTNLTENENQSAIDLTVSRDHPIPWDL